MLLLENPPKNEQMTMEKQNHLKVYLHLKMVISQGRRVS